MLISTFAIAAAAAKWLVVAKVATATGIALTAMHPAVEAIREKNERKQIEQKRRKQEEEEDEDED